MKIDRQNYDNIMQTGLVDYEREFGDLNLLLYPEILENTQKIDRILSSDVKNDIFLIGKQGVGRRSLTRLV